MNQSPGHLDADCARRYLLNCLLEQKTAVALCIFSPQIVNSIHLRPNDRVNGSTSIGMKQPCWWLAQAANGMSLPAKSGKDSAFCLEKRQVQAGERCAYDHQP